jgi:import receptor subunit TOM70
MPPTPTVSSLHPSDVEANSLVERVQDFVSEHKKTILIATTAAVVAAAGFAYLQYASASTEREQEVGEGKRKKKAKGGRKKKNVNGNEGPILEEKKPVVNGPPGKIYTPFTYGTAFDSV